MAIHDGDGEGLVGFLDWAASRGELPMATARSYSAAVKRILAVEPGAEGKAVAEYDVANLLDRFETLNRLDFTPASLNTYKSRFRMSVQMYLAWLAKDPNWKPSGRIASSQRATKVVAAAKATSSGSAQTPPAAEHERPSPEPHPAVTGTRLISYDLPLRPDLMVRLALPVDMTKLDAARLTAFIDSLAFDDAAEG